MMFAAVRGGSDAVQFVSSTMQVMVTEDGQAAGYWHCCTGSLWQGLAV